MSFLKAAEIAGLSVWDFADFVREKEIVWIKSEKYVALDIKKALQSIAGGAERDDKDGVEMFDGAICGDIDGNERIETI